MKKIFPCLFLLVLFFATSVQAKKPHAPSTVTDQRDAFIEGSIVVKGEGSGPSDRTFSPGQRRIMALRAAKLVALREASEIIDGVTVNGETVVKNAALESDDIYTAVQGVIKGAKIVKEEYDPVSETATVYLSIPLTGPFGLASRLVPGVAPLVSPVQAPYFQPYSSGLAEGMDYDGLIVDGRNYAFRPALINRVLSEKGDILYDPSDLEEDVLVERGGAGYTDSIKKARKMLGKLGSSNPVVIEARGLSSPTDVMVSSDDAFKIFVSDQKNGFLKNARVVFVLQ
ncbi:MAG: hypothetical protein BMS9Abin23_0734 [Thermodesulfobacteriota bacterium]|nr:MAG: hypothetical protein BMS9Abin23_0734 [Thermodesulfobacteriota bacterium]